jgi:hypothetical protein
MKLDFAAIAHLSPLPVLHGERVRVRGGTNLWCKQLPLTPTLSPLSAGMGRGRSGESS